MFWKMKIDSTQSPKQYFKQIYKNGKTHVYYDATV